MNTEYLKAFCKDLMKSASELGSSNEQILKDLNTTFLEIMNNSVSHIIIMRRLKIIENKIQNIKYKDVPIVSNLSKRALIVSNNENDSKYFNEIFKNFTTISISNFENENKLKECLDFVVKGKQMIIFTTIPLNVPHISSEQSIIIGSKCNTINKPTIEIYDNSIFGQKAATISRFLFITCSAMYSNNINLEIIKEFINCDIFINGDKTETPKIMNFVI